MRAASEAGDHCPLVIHGAAPGADLFAVLETPVQVASVETVPGEGKEKSMLEIRYELLKPVYLGTEMDVTMVGKDGMLFGSLIQ
jgi:hypothetical protein